MYCTDGNYRACRIENPNIEYRNPKGYLVNYFGSKNPNVKLFFTPINNDCKK